MSKYNIIANSILSTSSGVDTGNVILNYNQLSSLYDGNLMADNVNLVPVDNLYLEIDFGYRIRLDNFNAYLLSTTSGILDNIDFYYRDFIGDSYTKLYKDYNGEFYYAKEFPSHFAPVNLLLTISGVEGDLSEVITNNEEYSVSFGENGDQTQVDISDSDSSNLSNAHVLKIKNTSTEPMVDAYVCVDYTGKEEDFYLSISEDNEKFIGLIDGVAVTNDYVGFNYRWSLGAFDNVKITNLEQIELDVTTSGSVGTYTTQVMSMEHENDCTCLGNGPFNRNDSSFFITHTTGVILNTSLKVDISDNDYTMEIRSSNIDPLEYTKLFYIEYSHIINNEYYYDIKTKDLYTGSVELFIEDVAATSAADSSYGTFRIFDTAVSDHNGNIATFGGGSSDYGGNYGQVRASLLDPYGDIIISNIFVCAGYNLAPSEYELAEFARTGLLWYNSRFPNYELYCLNDELTIVTTITSVSFFSVDLYASSNSVWVIYYNESPGVFYIGYDGIVLANIPEAAASRVAGNYDGGCWVLEDSMNTIRKYVPGINEDGNLEFLKTVETSGVVSRDQTCLNITNDKTGKDGLWYIAGYDIVHIDSKGDIISGTRLDFLAESLKANSLGVLARRNSVFLWAYLDLNGNIISTGSGGYTQAIKTLTFKHCVEQSTHLLPLAQDPVWGTLGSLEWRKVPISGYFLPKTKYHQARLTFRTDEDTKSPIVTSIAIPKPLVIKDIPKDQTKDIYIKTEFTGNEHPHEYTSKLRCWWHIQED